MRDTQQCRVYHAENLLGQMLDSCEQGSRIVEIEGVNLTLPPEYKFASIDSVRDYVNAACLKLDIATVRVRERNRKGEGVNIAHYQFGEIAIPTGGSRWALREIVVLHELSHHLARGDGHGPRFVAAFIDLLTRMMGPEAGLAMRLICAADTKVKVGS
jgi:putative metallohydrolase (TIGR04338 family)